MFEYGRTIFYDKASGIVLYDSGEIRTSIEGYAPDYRTLIPKLQERDPETIGELKLEYGQYADDYDAGGYVDRIDLDTEEPLFVYPPTPGETEPALSQPALSERLAKAEENVAILRAADLDNKEMINGLGTMIASMYGV